SPGVRSTCKALTTSGPGSLVPARLDRQRAGSTQSRIGNAYGRDQTRLAPERYHHFQADGESIGAQPAWQRPGRLAHQVERIGEIGPYDRVFMAGRQTAIDVLGGAWCRTRQQQTAAHVARRPGSRPVPARRASPASSAGMTFPARMREPGHPPTWSWAPRGADA